MLIKENNSKNQEKNMKQTAKKYLRSAAALALFGGMVFMTPAALQAKSAADISVHVEVTVHGSDIGVSSDVLEDTVDALLESAKIQVEESGGSNVTELKIDIYKDDDGEGFRAEANWDDDDEAEIEKHCETQDAIDDIVIEEVNAFIAFIHQD